MLKDRDRRPAFSRSGNTSAFGKSDESLKTHVAPIIKEHLTAVAVRNNSNTSEYTRNIIEEHLHGSVPEEMREIIWDHAQRETGSEYLLNLLRRAIFGNFHETSLEGPDENGRPGIGSGKGAH